jgi:hypothetical protein
MACSRKTAKLRHSRFGKPLAYRPSSVEGLAACHPLASWQGALRGQTHVEITFVSRENFYLWHCIYLAGMRSHSVITAAQSLINCSRIVVGAAEYLLPGSVSRIRDLQPCEPPS